MLAVGPKNGIGNVQHGSMMAHSKAIRIEERPHKITAL